MAEIHPSTFYFSPEFKKNYDRVFHKKKKPEENREAVVATKSPRKRKAKESNTEKS